MNLKKRVRIEVRYDEDNDDWVILLDRTIVGIFVLRSKAVNAARKIGRAIAFGAAELQVRNLDGTFSKINETYAADPKRIPG